MKNMTSKLSGTGVAVVTPFAGASGNVDYDALKSHIHFLTKNRVDYLVVLGTTAETVTLDNEEKSQVLRTIQQANTAKLPLVLGIGGNNTRKVIEEIETTNLNGIEAVLSVSPYYNKPSQAGLCQHYAQIADKSPIPIILYNVPGRTGVNLSAESTLILAQHKNICGIKDASGNLVQMGDILRKKPDHFMVISGDDGLTLPQMSMGAVGAISVVANLLPAQFSEMIRQAGIGNFGEARKIHLELLPIMKAIFEEGNPAGVKAALSVLQHMESHVRLPLTTVSPELTKKISSLLKSLSS